MSRRGGRLAEAHEGAALSAIFPPERHLDTCADDFCRGCTTAALEAIAHDRRAHSIRAMADLLARGDLVVVLCANACTRDVVRAHVESELLSRDTISIAQAKTALARLAVQVYP